MLINLLLAAALVTASGAVFARDGYGRVVSVEPHFTVSFGTRYHDGFRVLYETGGHRYWTHSHHHPGSYIVLPPQWVHDRYPVTYGHATHGYARHGHGDHGYAGHGYAGHGYGGHGHPKHGHPKHGYVKHGKHHRGD